MFFLLGNLFLVFCQCWKQRQRKMRFLQFVKNNIRHCSVVFQRVGMTQANGAPRFCALDRSFGGRDHWTQKTLLTEKQKQVLTVLPKVSISLNRWTSYLDQQDLADPCNNEGMCHILILTSNVAAVERSEFLHDTLSLPQAKRIKLEDYATPLAWKSGQPFGIVAACSEENFAVLGFALMDDCLQVEDLLHVDEIISVEIEGSAARLLRTVSKGGTLPSPFSLTPSTSSHDLKQNLPSFMQDRTGDGDKLPSHLNEQAEFFSQLKESCDMDNQSNESLASSLCGGDDINSITDERDMCGGLEPLDGAGEAMATPSHRKSDPSKPPNILIYCGKKDTARRFESVKNILQECVNTECYVIYLLRHEHVLTTPWSENTALLVISSDKVYDDTDQAFLRYFKNGGTIISFSSHFDHLFVERTQIGTTSSALSLTYKHWNSVNLICGLHVYKNSDSLMDDTRLRILGRDSKSGYPVVLEANHYESTGVAVLSQVSLDKDPVEMAISGSLFTMLKNSNSAKFEVLTDLLKHLGMECTRAAAPCLTHCELYSAKENLRETFMECIGGRLKNNKLKSRSITLHFVDMLSDVSEKITADYLPVVLSTGKLTNKFDFAMYKKSLNTRTLGNLVMYADVLSSTMTVFDGLMFSLPEEVGVIAVARQQVSGKGRGGNAWLSPEGCAMFSLHVRIPLQSTLGQRCAYLQHIAALAVVEAVRTTPGYQDLDLRLKWPNDIYFGRNMKLGGVIVNSSIMGNTMHANVGVGFNVKNRNPTVCINDLVTQFSLEHGTALDTFATEQLIGQTVSQMEKLIDLFQQEGADGFLHLYYRRWLHSGAVIRLESEDGPEASVLGLDEHGYLLVQTTDGSTISAQPDNNSFDMMKNLLVMKYR